MSQKAMSMCSNMCVFVCRHVSLYRLFPELILYALLKAVCAKTNLCVFVMNRISPAENVLI